MQVVLGYVIHGLNFLCYTGRSYSTQVVLGYIIQGVISYIIQGVLTILRCYVITFYRRQFTIL
jgi:hypothetical protein